MLESLLRDKAAERRRRALALKLLARQQHDDAEDMFFSNDVVPTLGVSQYYHYY
jgi:hypothetical protein